MKNINNEQGYVLIFVLLFVTITFILIPPFFNRVIQDTKETTSTNIKNQKTYTLESAVEITKAVIETNNIQSEDDLGSFLQTLSTESKNILGEQINYSFEPDLNKITFKTNDKNVPERFNSTMTFTYKTFDKSILKSNLIVLGSEEDHGKIQGNISGIIKPENITSITSELYDYALQKMFYDFATDFKARNPVKKTSLDYDATNGSLSSLISQYAPELIGSNLYVNDYISLSNLGNDTLSLGSLWCNGPATIKGQNNKFNLVINDSAYIYGDLNLEKLDTLEVKGDLVIYEGSLIAKNINKIKIDGSLIVKGKIDLNGGGPVDIHVNNFAAGGIVAGIKETDPFIDIKSSNTDIFNK
jgi:hypothetical protein